MKLHIIEVANIHQRGTCVRALSFIFFAIPPGMWDLSSLTRDGNCAPALGAQSLHHGTTREVPASILRSVFRHCFLQSSE